MFLVNVPVGLAAVTATLRCIRETTHERAARVPDVVGMALLAIALGALAYGVAEGRARGWGSPSILAAFCACACATPLLLARSRSQELPALPLGLFRRPSFRLATVITVAFGAGFYALTFGNVLFLVDVWHLDTLAAGFVVAPSALTAALVAP